MKTPILMKIICIKVKLNGCITKIKREISQLNAIRAIKNDKSLIHVLLKS
jgi:hypothetical protein